MPKLFFCSDLHLGHLSILKYEPCRLKAVWQKYYKKSCSYKTFAFHFNTAFERKSEEDLIWLREILTHHDDLIINNWNAVVSKHDTVWFLGDFCMGGRSTIKAYAQRLHGIIRMVKGNHDNYPNKVYLEGGFRSVSEHPVVLKQKYILSHAPLDVFIAGKGCGDFINIFGHVHSSTDVRTSSKKHRCVCIERQKLSPLRLLDVENFQRDTLAFDNKNRHKNK